MNLTPPLKALMAAFASIILLHLRASAQPDSTYKVNDSVFSKASPQNITSSISFSPVSFDVNYTRGGSGGMVGGTGTFRGKITVTPNVSFDTASRTLHVKLDVKGDVLEQHAPGGLAELFYQLALQDVTYADQHITRMKIYLGNKDTTVEVNSTYADIPISPGITKFNGLEVTYDGGEVKVRKTMFFGKTLDLGGGSNLPWIIPIAVVVLAGAAYAAKKQRDKKKKSWIEIQLVNKENKPVSNEDCTITLPDNTVRDLKTDNAGKIRLQGIPQGTCRISFPKLDGSEWDKSTGTSISEKIEA